MTGPLVQAIGWALLHLLWQGVLVAAILAATLALLRRQNANARYLASCGALLLLVALGIATAYRMYEPAVATDVAAAASELMSDSTPLEGSSAIPPSTFSLIAFISAHIEQIVMIWLAGVVILSARLIAGWIGARRLAKRGTQPASDQWQRSLWRIASTLRLWRPIELLESAAVEVPTVIGWLRPVVLLPMASLSGLSTQQIEMVLAHELAHIRRHDFVINLMQSVVETLLFYHPAVWWISQRIRVEREHCCDDLAVAVFGDPLQYARALTRFEELRLTTAQSIVAANGGSLLARIRRLVVARAESANWSSRWAAGAALITVIAAMLAAPALPAFANRDQQKQPAPPAAPKTPAAEKAPKTEVDVEADEDSDNDAGKDTEMDNSDDQEAPTPPAPVAITVPRIHVAVAPAAGVEGGIHTRRRHIGEDGKLSVDDLITLRNAGVTPKYIDEMRSAGIGEITLDDIVELRMQGVTTDYVKQMASAGYSHLTARDLVELRAMGVSPAYIKTLADAGYTNLTVKDLVKLRASGVDAEFIRELSKYRSK